MFPLCIRPEADLSSSDCSYFDILIVLADFHAWYLILMLKVSGIKQCNKKALKSLSKYFSRTKKIITIYKRNEPHININNKLCGSIWKSSRPGLCELFRNQHKHLLNIWFWEMKLQNKQNFYKCVCRRSVCPVLLCWGLMWSHPPAAVNSWSEKYPS